MLNVPEVFVQVASALAVDPWTGVASGKLANPDHVVRCNTLLQVLTASRLQVRQQKHICSLQNVLNIFCKKKRKED